MKYISTRGKAPKLDFSGVLFSGLARDGGLYLPSSWPKFSTGEIKEFSGKSYEEMAFNVIKPFLGDVFSDDELMKVIIDAYAGFRCSVRCPLSEVQENLYQLELFHGPTFAFKDFAMQLVARMFDCLLKKYDKRITMLAATSGDTGAAAVEAFKGIESVDLFVLYPEGRISKVQQRQMTCANKKNIHALSVKGNFDDCQLIVKTLFADLPFRDRVNLSGVNSINWARILAQVVYYFSAYSQIQSVSSRIKFCVPTGNFGNIFAGYVAKKMGLPIDKLIVATNQNDILYRIVSKGVYLKEEVSATMSPSMDIQVSSNFERLVFELYHRSSQTVSELMESLKCKGNYSLSQEAFNNLKSSFAAGRSSEKETIKTISEIFDSQKMLICPHTAVGLNVAKKFCKKTEIPIITFATAHPAKFPDAVKLASGVLPDIPNKLENIFNKEEHFLSVPNSVKSVKHIIEERIKL